MSKKIINVTDIQITDFIQDRTGTFRAIVKTQSGALHSFDVPANQIFPDPLGGWKKGALQALEFIPTGSDFAFSVFARKGKKILWLDRKLAENLKVATVNQLFYNTNLYNQDQYRAVNSKTWDDYVFITNKKSK